MIRDNTPSASPQGASRRDCPACIRRGKRWNGSDPRCAFQSGMFDPDNWMCATANALRDACHENGHAQRWCDDSIGYIPIPDHLDERGFLVLLWYKDRGCTSSMYWMQEESPPQPVTLDLAQRVIEALKARSAPEASSPKGPLPATPEVTP